MSFLDLTKKTPLLLGCFLGCLIIILTVIFLPSRLQDEYSGSPLLEMDRPSVEEAIIEPGIVLYRDEKPETIYTVFGIGDLIAQAKEKIYNEMDFLVKNKSLEIEKAEIGWRIEDLYLNREVNYQFKSKDYKSLVLVINWASENRCCAIRVVLTDPQGEIYTLAETDEPSMVIPVRTYEMSKKSIESGVWKITLMAVNLPHGIYSKPAVILLVGGLK